MTNWEPLNLRLAFTWIRDIPYRIPLSQHDANHCCSGKGELLLHILRAHGLSVRWRVCTFRWSALPLPDAVLAVPRDDESRHAFLEVERDGGWHAVDPTWDRGLAGVLPIADWDGLSATPIAVPVMSLLTPDQSFGRMYRADPETSYDEFKRNEAFFCSLNLWLDTVRHGDR